MDARSIVDFLPHDAQAVIVVFPTESGQRVFPKFRLPRRGGENFSLLYAPTKGLPFMPLYLKAKLVGKSSGADREGKPYRSLQFLLEREARGGLDLIDVILPDDLDHTSFAVGEEFEIPIRVNAKDARLTYRYQLLDKSQSAS
jgi:hypothetical protein